MCFVIAFFSCRYFFVGSEVGVYSFGYVFSCSLVVFISLCMLLFRSLVRCAFMWVVVHSFVISVGRSFFRDVVLYSFMYVVSCLLISRSSVARVFL